MPPTTAARRAPAAARIAKLRPAPQTIEEALASKEARHWQKAIDVEMESLTDKNVWTPIITSPGVKPFGCRWLFQRNPTPQGIEYRARVVAKGGGLPSDAPPQEAISKPSNHTLFFLLAYAHTHQLHVTHICVEDPCLAVDLEQPVVIAIPPRQKFPGKNALLVTKALYGLKIAPAAGLQAMRGALKNAGLLPITQDPNLLADDDAGLDIEFGNAAIAMTYSGGVVVAGPKGYGQEMLDVLRLAGLNASRGPQDLIFGLTVRRDPPAPKTNGRFLISQPQYVDRVVQRYDGILDDPVPPSSAPTELLITQLKAFAGCMTWLTDTSHMRMSKCAFKLSRAVQRASSTQDWLNTWEDAYNMLQCLKDDEDRNCELRIQHTTIKQPPQLLATVRVEMNAYRITLMLHAAIFHWYMRKPQAARDEDEIRWCGIATAVESLIHWRAILGELGPVWDAAVIVDDSHILPTRPRAFNEALSTASKMQQEGIVFREFPSEDEKGHEWCPVCCTQGSGDGA